MGIGGKESIRGPVLALAQDMARRNVDVVAAEQVQQVTGELRAAPVGEFVGGDDLFSFGWVSAARPRAKASSGSPPMSVLMMSGQSIFPRKGFSLSLGWFGSKSIRSYVSWFGRTRPKMG
ncbi:hypothetical protein NONI108955_23480 [Nocardia ninae]|uniref:Uncharacterized protein n=1 Tax=Nocardia ninae NBRC 108245 TaxID=1210091 RepID=A0A511MGZ9_9NOCA|nr:hypothetical protein [Nocardia ninae]GEM39922.1 hypothetical protein NN4_44410 [Nocardia ninae NBRC 108245]